MKKLITSALIFFLFLNHVYPQQTEGPFSIKDYKPPFLTGIYYKNFLFSASDIKWKPKGGFSVYPNPVHNQINFEINILKAGKAQISIFDMSGKCFYQQNNYQVNTGSQVITLPLNSLLMPAGGYLVVVRIEKQLFTSRIVKN